MRSLSLQTIALCIFAALTIASDCTSLLGSWVLPLKYVGIIILCFLCVVRALRGGLARAKLICCLVALTLLVAILPFQNGDFSVVRALGLYAAVAILSCFSSHLLDSRQQLLAVCLFSTVLVVLFLALSYRSIQSQWSFYVGVGRPRFNGCFSNPNSLGNIAVVLFMGTLCSKRGWKLSGKGDVLTVALLLVTLFLILGSGSRTALATAFGFTITYWLAHMWKKRQDARFRFLLVVIAACGLAISAWLVWLILAEDVSFNSRLQSLFTLDFSSSRALVGLGYVSSMGVGQLTAAAEGVTEMLYVSLFYRVGVIGMVAYAFFVAGALCGNGERALRSRDLAFAVLVALLLQGVGESYLSSVMSFVSCFDWILLGAVPRLVADEDASEGPGKGEACA